MINWRDIELADRPIINQLICDSGSHGADYGFATLYVWRNAYNPRFAYVGGRLVVSMPQWHVYSYPCGSGNLSDSIEPLLEEAHSKGDNLVLRGLTDKTLEEFLPLYGDRFLIEEDRDNADYMYTTDHLCNLPGRKMSSKRNHINKFEKNGKWELRRITADNLDEAREFLKSFYDIKGDPDLDAEAAAIEDLFQNFEVLDAMAAILIQNGTTVAFSAGTRLDSTTFDVHFEKALADVDGAYAMINREFARMISNELPDIEYFNREEDLGIDGLRKAKLSYRPDILLMKYYAVERTYDDGVETTITVAERIAADEEEEDYDN